jgi:hypothetical protein
MSAMFDAPLKPAGQMAGVEKPTARLSGKSVVDIAMIFVTFAFVLGVTLFAGSDRSIMPDAAQVTASVSAK